MSDQESTPDPELLNQIAKEYEIIKKFLGTAEGMSELEAEVDKSIPAIALIRDGFDYDTISKRLGGYFPVAEALAGCPIQPVSVAYEGGTTWEEKNAYEIFSDIHSVVADLQKATRGTLVPHLDEFVLLLSVSKYQFLSKSSSLSGYVIRHYITNIYPRCSVMVLPDYGADGIIYAIAKVAGIYCCSSRYGI